MNQNSYRKCAVKGSWCIVFLQIIFPFLAERQDYWMVWVFNEQFQEIPITINSQYFTTQMLKLSFEHEKQVSEHGDPCAYCYWAAEMKRMPLWNENLIKNKGK